MHAVMCMHALYMHTCQLCDVTDIVVMQTITTCVSFIMITYIYLQADLYSLRLRMELSESPTNVHVATTIISMDINITDVLDLYPYPIPKHISK